jgi:hypothetical protein
MYDYTAQIVSSVPGRRVTRDRTTSLQILRTSREGGLEPRREYIALLWRSPSGNYFRGWDESIFPVVAGRVTSPAAGVLNGMPVADAMETLYRWSVSPRP